MQDLCMAVPDPKPIGVHIAQSEQDLAAGLKYLENSQILDKSSNDHCTNMDWEHAGVAAQIVDVHSFHNLSLIYYTSFSEGCGIELLRMLIV